MSVTNSLKWKYNPVDGKIEQQLTSVDNSSGTNVYSRSWVSPTAALNTLGNVIGADVTTVLTTAAANTTDSTAATTTTTSASNPLSGLFSTLAGGVSGVTSSLGSVLPLLLLGGLGLVLWLHFRKGGR